MTALVFPIVNGLLVGGCLGALIYANRRWRLALRRERALIQVVDVVAHGRPVEEYVAAMVGLADEMHNQERLRTFTRVPMPGKPWHDFEPAPVFFGEDEDRAA